jgi:DNA-binding transcriptional ArsR family regulator
MFIGKRCNCSGKGNKCVSSKRDLKKLCDNLTLLSVRSRLDLLFLLKEKSHCVCDLTKHTDMSQSLISHHLSDLTAAGLVKSRREGKYMDYYLTSKGEELVKTLMTMTGEIKGGENHNEK